MINYNNNLILIKGEDKTEQIESWAYRNGSYYITFSNGKTYTYHYNNVTFYKNPHVVDLSNTMIQKDGVALYAVKKVLVFEQHTKIIYENNYRITVNNDSLTFIHSALGSKKSKDCFEYLKQVAIAVGIKSGDGKNILASRYEKIDFVREDSVLASYLSGELRKINTNQKQILYPFGFNLSQKQAVEHAMLHSISVIEGPPGTGKTQTILNIIANALMNGESIAVVSSNNAATQNVFDKLHKNGIGFIAAYLGNGDNKKEFIQNQNPELPDLEQWSLETDQYVQIQKDLVAIVRALDSMLETRNTRSKRLQEREAVRMEYSHYMNYYNETNRKDTEIRIRKDTKSDQILKLLVALESEEKPKGSIWSFLYYYFRYGIKNRKFFQNAQDRKLQYVRNISTS